MNEIFLLKHGEIVLKGLNKRGFEEKLMGNIKRRLKPLGKFKVYTRQSTTYVEPLEESCDLEAAWDILHVVLKLLRNSWKKLPMGILQSDIKWSIYFNA